MLDSKEVFPWQIEDDILEVDPACIQRLAISPSSECKRKSLKFHDMSMKTTEHSSLFRKSNTTVSASIENALGLVRL